MFGKEECKKENDTCEECCMISEQNDNGLEMATGL